MADTFQTKYSIDCLRLSPDQKYLLCTQSKLNGAMWGGRIDVLDMSQSAKRVSASETSSVRVFTSSQHILSSYINKTIQGVTSADWMNNRMFVSGTDDGTVEIYRFNPDALKLTLTTTLNQHDRIVSSVAVKKESVLSASHDGLIHLWSISSLSPAAVKATFRGHHDVVQDVCWFEDENQFVSVGNEGLAFLWDTRTRLKSSSIRFSSDAVLCVDVFEHFVAVGMENGTVEIRDRRSSKKVLYRDETSHKLPVFRVLMKDEKLAVSASDDTTVRVHSLGDNKKGFTYNGHKDYVRALEWGPSGCVLSGGRDRNLHCWMYLLNGKQQ